VAFAGWNEHAYFGWRAFAELTGADPFAGLLALSVSGRRLSREEAALLDDVAASWTIADPRIWPLKVTRLVSSYGRPLAGVAAGLLACDCHYVGGFEVSPAAARLLTSVREQVGDAVDDEEAVAAALARRPARRLIPDGFGVPFREHDERLPVLRDCLERRGRAGLPYWRLLESMAAVFRRERKVEPNVGAAFAAICLDLGLASDDLGILSVALGTHMFFANAVEGARQQAAVLRCVPEEWVEYVGKEARVSPRAQAADDG
jgi:hypothetical protein